MFKEAYPIILSPDDDGYEVYSPDFDIYTQGSNIAEAIYMARDAISLVGVTLQDQGKDLPLPSDVSKIECKKDAITTFVDVDFDSYRVSLDNRSIRKNCTIPSWLNSRAEKADINFSFVLQEALISKLGTK